MERRGDMSEKDDVDGETCIKVQRQCDGGKRLKGRKRQQKKVRERERERGGGRKTAEGWKAIGFRTCWQWVRHGDREGKRPRRQKGRIEYRMRCWRKVRDKEWRVRQLVGLVAWLKLRESEGITHKEDPAQLSLSVVWQPHDNPYILLTGRDVHRVCVFVSVLVTEFERVCWLMRVAATSFYTQLYSLEPVPLYYNMLAAFY